MQRGGRARKWERWVVLGRTRLPRPWPWSGSGGARGRHIQRLCVGDSWQTSADGIDVGLGPVTLYRVIETLWLGDPVVGTGLYSGRRGPCFDLAFEIRCNWRNMS